MQRFCGIFAGMESFFERARAEGRIAEMSALDKLAYLAKYLFRPRLEGSPEEIEHFSSHHALLGALSRRPASTLATLGFVGDLMWIRRNWGAFLPPATLGLLRRFDGLVGNLETVISSRTPVNEFWPDLFRFNSDPRLVGSFRAENGENLFAALSFANNHCLDFEDEGALDTLAFLASEGIPQSGVSRPGEKRWTSFERGGIRFGFYAATFGLNDASLLPRTQLRLNLLPGLDARDTAMPDTREAESVLREMEKEGIECKIVSVHWGHEFEQFPTERVRATAKRLVLGGADVVTGSHPHFPQPAEVFLLNGHEPELGDFARLSAPGRKRKAIALYSLGNFVSAMFTAHCRTSTLFPLSFSRGPEGVDWRPERPLFFYSRNKRGGRELVALAAASLSPKEAAKVARLRRWLEFA